MGLISKTVIVKWNSKTKRWYESLGYPFTKIGDEFEVKVSDLTKGSNSIVDMECNGCKKSLQVKWRDYLKCIREYGDYYCHFCAMSIFTTRKSIETKLKNSISFEEWCAKNSRFDLLER